MEGGKRGGRGGREDTIFSLLFLGGKELGQENQEKIG